MSLDDELSKANNVLLLSKKMQMMQIDLSKTTEENATLRKQIDEMKSARDEEKTDYNRLKKEEMDMRQREALITSHNLRLESQLVDMKGDIERLVSQQQDL